MIYQGLYEYTLSTDTWRSVNVSLVVGSYRPCALDGSLYICPKEGFNVSTMSRCCEFDSDFSFGLDNGECDLQLETPQQLNIYTLCKCDMEWVDFEFKDNYVYTVNTSGVVRRSRRGVVSDSVTEIASVPDCLSGVSYKLCILPHYPEYSCTKRS